MAVTVTSLVTVLVGFGFICDSMGKSTTGLLEVVKNNVNKDVRQPIEMTGINSEGASMQERFTTTKSNATISVSLSIDMNKVIHTVDRRYLSTGFGTKELTVQPPDLPRFNPRSTILQTLVRGLSPAVLRVGGRPADETLFKVNNTAHTHRPGWIPVTKFITGEQWKSLNEFTTKCGVDLVFTLNVLLRKGDSWDPTNARELLDFNADLGYRVIWQLGNEPTLFRKNYNRTLSAPQLAKDFVKLRGILSEGRYRHSNELVGPDVTHLPIQGSSKTGIPEAPFNYLKSFLEGAGGTLNATTLHFYNIRQNNFTSVDNFTGPDILMRTRLELREFRQIMKDFMPTDRRTKWLGESSSVSGGGLENASNRYVAGFPILHNLGVAAQMGVSVFIYWNLFGGHYGLLEISDTDSEDVTPSALYWACFLHKRLVGTKVLSTSSTFDRYNEQDMANDNNETFIHVFAHCTAESSLYPAGAVTLMALNMHNYSEASLKLIGDLANRSVDEYLLTAPGGNIISKKVSLNGNVLEMKNSTHFPDIKPHLLPKGSRIVLPAMTYAFYVIRDANATVCPRKQTDSKYG